MSVHSKQLSYFWVTSTGYSTLYTCPAGFRTIVKSVLVQNEDGSARRAELNVKVGTNNIPVRNYYLSANHASGDSFNDNLWLVLNAGDLLQLAVSGGSGVSGVISGAELSLA